MRDLIISLFGIDSVINAISINENLFEIGIKTLFKLIQNIPFPDINKIYMILQVFFESLNHENSFEIINYSLQGILLFFSKYLNLFFLNMVLMIN